LLREPGGLSGADEDLAAVHQLQLDRAISAGRLCPPAYARPISVPVDSIRIPIPGDHAIVRRGFCALLEHAPEMHVVAESKYGREAVEIAKRTVASR
jgi:hypothetical protein